MATVHADYQDRTRIVFTARGREHVNVREKLDDGPIGYSSTELLLVALGNCTLGHLLADELLRDVEVVNAEVTLDAEMARNPVRVAKIDVAIDIVLAEPSLLSLESELQAISCSCPICNTLGSVEINSTLRLTAEPQLATT
jgi:uncharacterized OsmC-like protein